VAADGTQHLRPAPHSRERADWAGVYLLTVVAGYTLRSPQGRVFMMVGYCGPDVARAVEAPAASADRSSQSRKQAEEDRQTKTKAEAAAKAAEQRRVMHEERERNLQSARDADDRKQAASVRVSRRVLSFGTVLVHMRTTRRPI
jgi:pyruvate/2-oxoglutarate dehydrogenase complex dihydrolipoamide acyltransferase (E2) component